MDSGRKHALDGDAHWRHLTNTTGWLVGWGLTALLTQNRSYRACRFVGIFYSKL